MGNALVNARVLTGEPESVDGPIEGLLGIIVEVRC
jgi:hypothetical protein